MPYTLGNADNLGTPTLVLSDWPAFVARLGLLSRLAITRNAYAKADSATRQRSKRTGWFVPATLPMGQRRLETAGPATLACIDVDDHAQALRVLASYGEVLSDINHVLYHTASSTPAHTKLRVVVETPAISPASYASAVRALAALLQVGEPTGESLSPVQLMYLPTVFADDPDEYSPILSTCVSGRPWSPPAGVLAAPDAPADALGLATLRPPLELSDEDTRALLALCDPAAHRPERVKVMAALRHQYQHDPERGFALFEEWAANTPPERTPLTKDDWERLQPYARARAGITLRSLKYKAQNEAHDVLLGAWKRQTAHGKTTREAITAAGKGLPEDALIDSAVLDWVLANCADAPKRPVLKAALRTAREKHADEQAAANLRGWVSGLCYLSGSNRFLDTRTGDTLAPEALNLAHAADVPEGHTPQDYALTVAKAPVYYATAYRPDLAGQVEVLTPSGSRAVNTYRPSGLSEDAARAGDAARLLREHTVWLFGAEEAPVLLWWLAHNVQLPGKKIRWAPVLVGCQGCGKSWYAALLGALLGPRNVRVLDNASLHSNWNDWAEGACVAVVEEVRAEGQSRGATLDSLKPLVSNDTVTLRCRYEPVRECVNTQNYLLLTNHGDALPLSQDDRRYSVLKSAVHRETLRGAEYYQALFGSLADNPGGYLAALRAYPLDKYSPDARAPQTKGTQAMHEEGLNLPDDIRRSLDSGEPQSVDALMSAYALAGERMTRQMLGRAMAQAGYDRFRNDGKTFYKKSIDILS